MLVGGPAPVLPPPPVSSRPVFQDEAMARANAVSRLQDRSKNAQIWADIVKSGWLDLGRR